jgi:HK97 family phage prohead protease
LFGQKGVAICKCKVSSAGPLVEVRIDGDEPQKIKGYAAVFDRWSEDLGGFREIIRKGAFSKTVSKADVRALFNHDPNYVLGRTKSGTLALTEDDKGLAIEISPPDAQWARDLMVSISRGDISQMSFGFRVPKNGDKWTEENGKTMRELLEVELFDVSPVTFPAYPQTSVGVRSAEDVYQAHVAEAQARKATDEKEKPQARVSMLRRRLDLTEKAI